MAENLTGPMRVALCSAIDQGGLYPRVPTETNRNTVNAMWTRRLIDDAHCITPYGRAALADDLAQRRRQPASAGI
jgi:hypothetical protein